MTSVSADLHVLNLLAGDLELFEQGGLQEDLDIEAFPTALEGEAHMFPAEL